MSAMRHPITGLHHVTATVDRAQPDLDFCTGLLALRLVKRTVNFDNHGVYHFYYGDERGTPGTIWTTFPYGGRGVPAGVKGAGQITATAFSVPSDSLDAWRHRLEAAAVPVADAGERFGDPALLVHDPSGLAFELVGSDADRRTPWTGGGADPAVAIRGLHTVTLTVASPGRTIELLTGLLGFEVADEAARRTRLAIAGGGPGRMLDLVHDPDAPPARNGLGTVHHVALAIEGADQQRRLRAELVRLGLGVTEVMDRCYFESIYFREPGGVLLEVATVEPGFAVDESPAALGTSLKLPPWEEPHRAAIEAALPPVVVRGM